MPCRRLEVGLMLSYGATSDYVQVRNARTGHYIKIDRARGLIVSVKRTAGPYKGVPIARKRGSS